MSWQILANSCRGNTKLHLQAEFKTYIPESPDAFFLQVGNHMTMDHLPALLRLLDFELATKPDSLEVKARIKRPMRNPHLRHDTLDNAPIQYLKQNLRNAGM